MRQSIRFVLYLLSGAALVTLAVSAGGVWVVQRALPSLDGSAALPELRHEVTVERDQYGVPRLRAASLDDLLVAQGYAMAQDRLWQMDLLRRVASGELSEIFGEVTLELDREARRQGLRQAADRAAAELDDELRPILEAYARGVNRYIMDRRGRLPWEFVVLRYEPRLWTPTDTLLVGGYMYRVLTSSWRSELNRARVTELVGSERALELFAGESPRDHLLFDTAVRAAEYAQSEPKTVRGFSAHSLLEIMDKQFELAAGSNNWVVSGQHTYSGKPLLANDTHLPLEVPAIWYMVHLTAPDWNVKGFALPGVPLVIIGHNDHIAWGFTNTGADVQDLFIETFHPENPRLYRAGGQWIEAEVRQETIHVRDKLDELLDIFVTRNGPIVHREDNRGYALKWVATEPGGLRLAYPLLGRARNWDEFLSIMARVPGPAQNTVYADVEGNIGFLVAAHIPVRRTGDGSLPVPGDSDEYAWTGYVPFDELPRASNPPEGFFATANARVVGPSYPHHLTDRWMPPYRTERTYNLLRAGSMFRPEDFIAIQTDILSLPHRWLAAEMVRAAEASPPPDERLRFILEHLRTWDGMASADGYATTFVEFTYRELRRMVLEPVLGAELNRYTWPRAMIFFEHLLRDRPAHWLPDTYESYDALLIAAAAQAASRLERETRRSNPADWRWGAFMRLDMLHPIGRSGLRRRLFSFPPVEQHGSGSTVKQTGRSFGPAMRFVADLADWDRTFMNIPAGQSGQWMSPHYRDQFKIWIEGEGLASAFSDEAQRHGIKHTLRLVPVTP
jgi:penicillin G amidase